MTFSTAILTQLQAFVRRMEILNPAEGFLPSIGAAQMRELRKILKAMDPSFDTNEEKLALPLLRALQSAVEQVVSGSGCPECPDCPPASVDLLSFGLTTVNGTDSTEYFAGVTSLDYNFTELGDGIFLSSGDTLESISFSSLEELTITGGFVFVIGLPALVSADFSSLTRWMKISPAASTTCGISQCPLLTTLLLASDFTVDEPFAGSTDVFDFTGNALPQATIDFILVRAAATMTAVLPGGTQLQILLDGGTNATPSAAGLAAKTTLQARGVTVTNN